MLRDPSLSGSLDDTHAGLTPGALPLGRDARSGLRSKRAMMADKKELLCRLVTVHAFERPGDYGVPIKSGEDALYFDADGRWFAANYGLVDVPIRESEIRIAQLRDVKFPVHVLIVRAEYPPGETNTDPTHYKLVLDNGNAPIP